MAKAILYPAGTVFGRLTIVREAGLDKHGRKLWLCQCVCRNETVVAGFLLRSGHTRSCGCLHEETLLKGTGYKHGLLCRGKRPDGVNSWAGMIQRCTYKKHKSYKNYGGRGITVCDRWRNSVEDFLTDMGPRPTSKHMIERIDNDGPYSPENCRWATNLEQSRNRQNNRLITFNGEAKTASEWRDLLGVPYKTLIGRANGGRPLIPEAKTND